MLFCADRWGNRLSLPSFLKTDMLAWMLAGIAILLTILAVTKQRRSFLVLAFFASLLAVTAKYIMLPVVVLPILVSILLIQRTRVRIAVISAVGGGDCRGRRPPANASAGFPARIPVELPGARIGPAGECVPIRIAGRELAGICEAGRGVSDWRYADSRCLPGCWCGGQRANSRCARIQLLLAVAATGVINLLLLSLFNQSEREHYRYLVILCFALILGRGYRNGSKT